ncbi:MAG: very short patch repair endonuclease [Muribaculaceae bacterium]|nr:very short patch repair endonuclease [Muribaculaceae bacterium]MBQ9074227.1 very short patch repair endonuclease [Muribaculaceae bacterium]
MDVFTPHKRSSVMAKIRSCDTKPELIVRRYLWSRGYRYRKNVKGLPGTPDIILKKYRVAIFVHGCFWHGHDDSHLPNSNRDFWQRKIERNQKRDLSSKEALKRMGWNVMTIWECQLKPSRRQNTLREMESLINSSFLSRYKPTSSTYQHDYEEQAVSQVAEPQSRYGGKRFT